ncbi:MAG TPA: ABC transporter permease [Candidatus Krumholzibacteria bacterium]|jgi:putative ABC transport system permease protein
MLRLVLRQLALDRTKTALTCVAIGGVVALLLLLEGFEQGLYEQLRRTVLDRGGSLIVTQAGVSNMTAARSVLPQLAREEVESVDGVRTAHPLTGLPVIYPGKGRKTPIFLVVYDTAGAPSRIVSGRAIRGEREIIIDRSLAQRYDLYPGDPLVVSDFRFEIVGVSEGTAALFTPFAFINYDSLIDFYLEADLARDISAFPLLSFLVVELSPGADRAAVLEAIEDSVPSVDVFEPSVLANNDVKVGAALFGPTLWLLKGIGSVIGILVVGMLMFASVGGRLRELGVLKAIGFGNRRLFVLVAMEAVIVTVLSVPIGIGLARAVATLIGRVDPLYLILPLEPAPMLRTLLACLGFAVFGALAPARTMSRVDPALVFHS